MFVSKSKAKKRGPRKGTRKNKVIKISVPKKLYLVLRGISGGDDQNMNKLIRVIIEDRLREDTVENLMEIANPKKSSRSKEEEEEEEIM